jgi:hypothetical protein
MSQLSQLSQRTSRNPVAALIVACTLCLLPALAPPAAAAKNEPRAGIRLPLSHSTESRLLDRLERWRASLWKDVVGLWGQAGARIDENGKS